MARKTSRGKSRDRVEAIEDDVLTVEEALWLPDLATARSAPRETYAQKMQRLVEERRTKKVSGKKKSLKRAKKRSAKKKTAKRKAVKKSARAKTKERVARKAAKR